MIRRSLSQSMSARLRLALTSLAGAFVLVAGASSARAFDYTCGVGFDSYQSLAALPQKACSTFASTYTQACGSDNFTVTPSVNGHFHLSMQNPCTGNCLAPNGCMGIDRACQGTGTGCANIADAATQPRFVATHLGNEVVTFVGPPAASYCENGGCVSLTGKMFTPTSIKVMGTQAVQIHIWVIKHRAVASTPGGTIYQPYKEERQWTSLAAGTTWNLGNEGLIDKMTIQSANPGNNLSFSFDNIGIGVTNNAHL